MIRKYLYVLHVPNHLDYLDGNIIVVSMDLSSVINAHNFFRFQLLVRTQFQRTISRFFSIPGYLIEPQSPSNKAPTTNGVIIQRSNSLTSLASTVGGEDLGVPNKDGANNEDYLRICLSCREVLQKRYDQLCFKKAEKDEVFLCYEVNSL